MSTVSARVNASSGNVEAKARLAQVYHDALLGRFQPLGDLASSGALRDLSLDEVTTRNPLDASLLSECCALVARAAPTSPMAAVVLRKVATALAQRFPEQFPEDVPHFRNRGIDLLVPALSELSAGPASDATIRALDALVSVYPGVLYIAMQNPGGPSGQILISAIERGNDSAVSYLLDRFPKASLEGAAFVGSAMRSGTFDALLALSVSKSNSTEVLSVLVDFASTQAAKQLGIEPVGTEPASRLLALANSEAIFADLLRLSLSQGQVQLVCPDIGKSAYQLALEKGFIAIAESLRNLGLGRVNLSELIRCETPISKEALGEALQSPFAGVNLLSAGGDRPLVAAANIGRLDLAQALLVAGADPNLHDAQGQSALQACQRGSKIELKALLAVRAAHSAMQNVVIGSSLHRGPLQ